MMVLSAALPLSTKRKRKQAVLGRAAACFCYVMSIWAYMLGVSQTLVLVHVTFCVSLPTFSVKSPSSSVHRPSAPTNASSLAGNWKVTVLVSPGANTTLVKSRSRRLSGTMLAMRSLEYSSTASFPARRALKATAPRTGRSPIEQRKREPLTTDAFGATIKN